MNLTEALTEFFGVKPIRSAVESELPNVPLVVVINRLGLRSPIARNGFCKTEVMITAYFRIETMTEIELVEMLHQAFRQYLTAGRWFWKKIDIQHGEQALKSGNHPKMIPFEINFEFYSTP